MKTALKAMGCKMDSFPSLDDICVYSDGEAFEKPINNESVGDHGFVGIKSEGDDLHIYFPIGYHAPNVTDRKGRDNAIRQDIKCLISVLRESGRRGSELKSSLFYKEQGAVKFPVAAYLFIMQDFLEHGIYTQSRALNRIGQSGKVQWARTIRQIRPIITERGPVYNNTVICKKAHDEDNEVTKIHRYCVYECFSKLGFLYAANILATLPKPSKYVDKKHFASVLQRHLAQTFCENNVLLLRAMIAVLRSIDAEKDGNNFIFGTREFHVAWEMMIDNVYGERDKDAFYPATYWCLSGGKPCKNATLQPDTIMITHRGTSAQRVYVLDAKYYRYGETKDEHDLPDSYSIVKQMAYAQYIDIQRYHKTDQFPQDVQKYLGSNSIFNVFVMPACNSRVPICIGYATTDYVESDVSYGKIYVILLDTRNLMMNHRKKDNVAT